MFRKDEERNDVREGQHRTTAHVSVYSSNIVAGITSDIGMSNFRKFTLSFH